MRVIAPVLAFIFLCSCASMPVSSSASLASKNDGIRPEKIEQRGMLGQEEEVFDKAALRKNNEAAGKPTFGLIKGFYQLPETMPAGAIIMTESTFWGQSYRTFELDNLGTERYAVVPASTQQSLVFTQAMNQLLDAGVQFKEVSMADAVKVMEAERRMIQKKRFWFPRQSLPSGVDLLISVQKGFAESGSVYVGRVIRTKDGRLLALDTQTDVGMFSLKPLITRLVRDSLKRLAESR